MIAQNIKSILAKSGLDTYNITTFCVYPTFEEIILSYVLNHFQTFHLLKFFSVKNVYCTMFCKTLL